MQSSASSPTPACADVFVPAAVWLSGSAAPSTSNHVAEGDGKPTAEWIARQLTEACGWDAVPDYIVRDRDCIYGEAYVRRLRAMGIRDRPTAPRSPWQNACAERLIGSIRREVLDHVIVFGERHLRQVLSSYMTYHNEVRTHLALNKDAPVPRAIQCVGRIFAKPYMRKAKSRGLCQGDIGRSPVVDAVSKV